jgi:hypothetical protein
VWTAVELERLSHHVHPTDDDRCPHIDGPSQHGELFRNLECEFSEN